jgi:hypothetical protein
MSPESSLSRDNLIALSGPLPTCLRAVHYPIAISPRFFYGLFVVASMASGVVELLLPIREPLLRAQLNLHVGRTSL